jgi:hypothetical protein
MALVLLESGTCRASIPASSLFCKAHPWEAREREAGWQDIQSPSCSVPCLQRSQVWCEAEIHYVVCILHHKSINTYTTFSNFHFTFASSRPLRQPVNHSPQPMSPDILLNQFLLPSKRMSIIHYEEWPSFRATPELGCSLMVAHFSYPSIHNLLRQPIYKLWSSFLLPWLVIENYKALCVNWAKEVEKHRNLGQIGLSCGL